LPRRDAAADAERRRKQAEVEALLAEVESTDDLGLLVAAPEPSPAPPGAAPAPGRDGKRYKAPPACASAERGSPRRTAALDGKVGALRARAMTEREERARLEAVARRDAAARKRADATSVRAAERRRQEEEREALARENERARAYRHHQEEQEALARQRKRSDVKEEVRPTPTG